MDKVELEKRTKQFAIRIIKFAATLPYGKIGDVIRYQLVKAGTSVGANYREANRAESRNDFIDKIGIVEKEASESQYWLEICDEANLGDATQRRWLLAESGELLAIFTSSGRTAKAARA
ncbi:MAG: four helix bundle protein [Pyrinomonadaceae bacterium]